MLETVYFEGWCTSKQVKRVLKVKLKFRGSKAGRPTDDLLWSSGRPTAILGVRTPGRPLNLHARYHGNTQRYFSNILTLKWPRYFYSRWCPRGVLRDPSVENHFSTGILQYNLHHICMGYKNSQFGKKNENVVPFQNGGQITNFDFASFRFWPKFENHFPKGIFQWNWAQSRRTWIHLHYWNNIWKKLFRFKMAAKTIFWYCAIMLIYAN